MSRNLGRLHDMLQEFHSRDVQLKDSVPGLVDFPYMDEWPRDLSLLRKPEAHVILWHATGSGFPDTAHVG